MYALLARIPEGLEPLRKRFEEHVKKAGLAAVEKLSSGKGAAAAGADAAAAGGDDDEEAGGKSEALVGPFLSSALASL